MNERGRILFITRNFPPVMGGMERMLFHTYESLVPQWETAVVGPAKCETIIEPTRVAGTFPLQPTPLFVAACLARSLLAAKSFRPSIVLSGSGVTAPFATLAARMIGAKSATFVYGLDLLAPSLVYQSLFVPAIRNCDRIISISANTTQLAIQKGVHESKISVLHPGVSIDSPVLSDEITEFRRRIGVSATHPLLLSVGRLTQRKGLVDFIGSALPLLVKHAPNIRLVIIGGEPKHALNRTCGEEQRIRNTAASLNLSHHIILLGETDDTTVRAAYGACNLLVFPVLDLPGDVEGFGMVAIEAAAHGLPTVAFAVGGVPDAIKHGESGYLVGAGNYTAFAATIVQHLESQHTEAWHSRCRRHAERFAWGRYGERLNAILRNLAHDKVPPTQ